MPLSAIHMFPGGPIQSADLIQYFNLLTGAMTDQPVTLANTLTAGGSHGIGSVPLRVNGVNAQTANMHEIRALATDVNPIFAIGPDGTLKWGPGGGVATDTTLSRSSPGALRVSGLSIANYNLLVNPGLEIWQRGTAFGVNNAYTADGWQMVVAGTDAFSVQKDTTHVDVSSNACAFLSFTLGTGAGSSGLQHLIKMSEHALQGKTVSVSVRVSTTLANAIRVNVGSDGTGAVGGGSTAHPGDGIYHTLTATATIPANATFVTLAVNLYAGTTQAFYVDNATLVVGSVPVDYTPLSSEEEWARCLRRYQRWPSVGSGALHLIATGSAAGPGTAYMILPLQQRMGGAPTLTFSALGDWTITNTVTSGTCTGLSIYAASGTEVALQGTCASGLTGGQSAMLQGTNPGSGNDWLALEWNP